MPKARWGELVPLVPGSLWDRGLRTDGQGVRRSMQASRTPGVD